tara:strand:- start:787 stop:1131 length:345 start_codon:yes stop_codon:yes gene_type:complete
MNLNLLLALSQQPPSRQEEGRTMDIIRAAESVLKGQMDTQAFAINTILQKQKDIEDVDNLLNIIHKYATISAKFEILQKVKGQLQAEMPPEPNISPEQGCCGSLNSQEAGPLPK